MDFSARLRRVQTTLNGKGWDALLVYRPDEIRYLTGARGTAVRLLVGRSDAVLLSHFVDLEQCRLETTGVRIRRMAGLGVAPEVAEQLSAWGAKRLAVGADGMSVAAHRAVCDAADAIGAEVIPDEGIIREMRMRKDAEELALLRRAAEVNDAAFEHILPMLKPGAAEKDVAEEIRRCMMANGAEAVRFLVAQSGPHSALPHYYPTDRVLQPGDFVLLDWVPLVDGYASDMTRTVVIGEPSKRQRDVYELVRRAQLAGLQAVHPGATGHEVDGAARRIIDDAGYGEYFGHSLGHGINEGPNVDKGSKDVLEARMVITIEPGIYIPGWGGVRIEDTVVVTPEGAEALPVSTKDLTIL